MSNDVISLVERRAEQKALSEETVKVLRDAIEQGWRGNVVAIGVCVAFREEGGVTRTAAIECDKGQHVYLVGLCQRLTAKATNASLWADIAP